MDAYMELFNWLADSSSDPQLGLKLANDVDLTSFGGGTYMVYHASNLRDCWNCLARYDQTISQGIAISYVEDKDGGHIQYKAIQPSHVDITQDSEMTMAMLVNFCRQHLGDNWVPQQVQFIHSVPSEVDSYHALFGNSIRFGKNINSMFFTKQELHTTIDNADPYLLEVLRQHTLEQQEKILRPTQLREQVRYFIARSVGNSECTALEAASQLFMSRRTLTRQLKQQNTSFRELRNEVTEEMAKKALLETNASISEIALQLGYSETSAFDRAFKLLTGLSPSHYRQRNE
tara:strand:- start:4377 stop:5243 length:867 start_codon:yes stop_codon:yes gene_type:complete